MSKKVINPYNFVPFAEKVKRESCKEYYNSPDNLLTGYIDFDVINTTPLIIPDATSVTEENDHKTYSFLKIKDEKNIERFAIPGSEIRGMVRSTYEAFTNSCVNHTPTDSPISQRTPLYASFRKRGLLSFDKNGKVWTLYGAKVYKNKSSFLDVKWLYSGHEAGELVSFYLTENNGFSIDDSANRKGYLQFNTPFSYKEPYNFAVLDANSVKVLKQWGDIEKPLKYFGGSISKNDNRKCKSSDLNDRYMKQLLKISRKGGMIPVYYRSPKNSKKHNFEVYLYSNLTPKDEKLQRRGLLDFNKKKNVWTLFETNVYINQAKKFDIQGTYCKHKNGDLVGFTSEDDITFNICDTDTKGYLQFNTPVDKKGSYTFAILVADTNKVVKSWEKDDDSPYRLLKSAIHRDGLSNKSLPETDQNIQLKDKLDKLKEEGGMIPVYYECDQGRKQVYLSPSVCGRIGREKKWNQIYGNNSPCKDINYLCPACLLFGSSMNEKSDISGFKGRLRFTDALIANPSAYTYVKTLPILGGPNPSAFEFYLNRPEGAIFWNFDYYVKPVVQTINKKEIVINEFMENDGIIPRGRKFYYHHEPIESESVAKTKMNSTFEVLGKNNTFKSRVYFDGITKKQLDDLVRCLDFKGKSDNDEKYQHKIGHGKPLGYGSIAIKIIESKVRYLSVKGDNLQYEEKEYNLDENAQNCGYLDENIRDSILTMSDFERAKGGIVTYPYAYDKKGKEVIYKWFADNRRTSAVKTLPNVLDDDISIDIPEIEVEDSSSEKTNNNS